MKINEIVTESTELEEGWKSKLAGAALAGAAALGGGGSDVQAQNHKPTAQTQQAKNSVPKELSRYVISNTVHGRQSTEALTPFRVLAQQLGNIAPFAEKGMLTPEQARLYDKFRNIYLQARLYLTHPGGIDAIFSGAYRGATYNIGNRLYVERPLMYLKKEAENYSKSVK